MKPAFWKTPPAGLLHGADYNPEQWPRDIWREDMRLMKKAGINVVSIGIFSWSHLEPADGVYDFTWLDEIAAQLKESGISVILATPSGARPPWLAHQHPEVLRVEPNGIRNLYGLRHNHCPTSPVYRRKTAEINRQLARRYGPDDNVILWHVSNEYSGECHCPLCQAAFQQWLMDRYGTLDRLNDAWYCAFWSHRYTAWEEIQPPAERGESRLHGLTLAWRRFVSHQTTGFLRAEIAALREHDARTPVTTNLMGFYPGINYFELAEALDIASNDNYPAWHSGPAPELPLAASVGGIHDLTRSLKGGQPFLLMECTPSSVNWMEVNTLKRPGMHRLAALQAVAHGADSVQYFQWRKSRGASEKFHGAVVDHCGHEDTRVFREVSEVGSLLSQLSAIAGTRVPAEAAVLYDWENRWAIDDFRGFRNDRKNYLDEVRQYHRALWARSVSCDCINAAADFSRYKLLVAPMLYLLQPGVPERLAAFVRKGGCLVTSALTGTVDQDDLVFPGGAPGPLRELLGFWVEETDALPDGESAGIIPEPGHDLPGGPLAAREICERLRIDTAEPIARYGSQFYAGEPCITVNAYGQGRAYHVACRAGDALIDGLLAKIIAETGAARAWPLPLPHGVNAQRRRNPEAEYVFLLNFNDQPVAINAPGPEFLPMIAGPAAHGRIALEAYGVAVYRRDLPPENA